MYSPLGAEAVGLNYFSNPNTDGTTLPLQFNCTGNESGLLECPYSQLSNCSANSMPVGVVCKVPCANGDLRVIGGGSMYEGRLEVCRGDSWGTICQDSWGSFDAIVACRQLGFSSISKIKHGFPSSVITPGSISILLSQTGAVAFGEAKFGEGIGAIHLTQVQCTGEESNLMQCSASNATDSCHHSMDVGIMCSGPQGSCESAGFSSCCNTLLGNCNVNGCFCDTFCVLFNDCCDDIQKICTQLSSDG